MGQIDLKNMSLKELQTLEKKVARAIAAHEKRERKNALAELAAKAKQLGFSLDELIGDKKTVANVPAATNQKARKKVEAEEIKKKLTDVGAKVALKGV